MAAENGKLRAIPEVDDNLLPDFIALIGMMGAGKSTIGRLLSETLGRSYYDSDQVVIDTTGKSVGQMFRENGESVFRDAEAAAVDYILACPPPAVVGIAGGAVLRPDTRKALQDKSFVVWLKVPIETLVRRVSKSDGTRPLIGEDTEGVMKSLYVDREPLYAELADVTIDGDASPEIVVFRVMEAIS